MNKKYIICWDDWNHFPVYWLNGQYLGTEMKFIVEKIIDLQLPKNTQIIELYITGDDFTIEDEKAEQLFDYFQSIPSFDDADIRLMENEDWENFYNKNIKKIMRKVLTNKKS